MNKKEKGIIAVKIMEAGYLRTIAIRLYELSEMPALLLVLKKRMQIFLLLVRTI